MQLRINGTQYEVPDTPERPLVSVIHDELGLIGTKIGCGAGFCGVCTIHLNGEPVRSCQTPLSKAAGAELRTVEGLAETQADGSLRLHPIQQAFIELQVPQCSWCMSGQMMTALALLTASPNPSEEQVVEAMDKNFCRCGCYVRLKAAVLRAGELMRSGVRDQGSGVGKA